ncbi:hypothetical protein FYJ26_02895 [Anaerococcus sp. WCA-380-WT-2B]|uniref:Uncharacterized protein n=1 Tax=Anaerococcus porci TaxID=2652269 RepID=A0A6N7VTG9_9FIRM|nr:hypothetical protein [Anaerococcus porci]MSS77373.1 hypothetical protein [Anaerococcus porci]
MFKIEKMYYSGLNETKVRLMQEDPYRDFVVSLIGDRTKDNDDILRQEAISILNLELNPTFAIGEIKKELIKQKKMILDLQTTIVGGNLTDSKIDDMLGDISDKLGVEETPKEKETPNPTESKITIEDPKNLDTDKKEGQQ